MIKKFRLLLLAFLCTSLSARSQEHWFHVYQDSTQLVKDASAILSRIDASIQQMDTTIRLQPNQVIKNTTPYLIYIDLQKRTVNLPMWSEVIPPQKEFFVDVAGDATAAEEVFGLFFNGFYLVHEYGHAFGENRGRKNDNAYDDEYDANQFAIAYWKYIHREKELERCYQWAKKMLLKLKNPVPAGEDRKRYLTAHYDELSADPYQYGYIQFTQFVEIYENEQTPGFLTLIQQYKKGK